MEEIWKDIKGYEGYYQVSNLGNVKSLKRTIIRKRNDKTHQFPIKERMLKFDYSDGYKVVKLCKQGEKAYKVHRLVAEAFIPNPNNLPIINHKDETRTNNCVDNLEWCDNFYNCNYGTINDRRKKKRVLQIEKNITYSSLLEAEKQTGIQNGNISKVCNGVCDTAGGYHWQFV